MIEIDLSVDPLWPREEWQAVCDQAVCAALNVGPYKTLLETQATVSISIAFADNAQVHKLNHDYRDKNKPTNILSFPMMEVEALKALNSPLLFRVGAGGGDYPPAQSQIESPHPNPSPKDEGLEMHEILLGDMMLAYEICADEAAEKGVPLSQHVTHLIIHGTLHLLGFDHIEDADAEHMEALEVKALASMGLANPYSE